MKRLMRVSGCLVLTCCLFFIQSTALLAKANVEASPAWRAPARIPATSSILRNVSQPVWEGPGVISPGADAALMSSSFASLAVNRNGVAIVAWSRYYISEGRQYVGIYATRYLPGSGWSEAVQLSDTTNNAYPPKVGVDGAGNAIVVWGQPGANAEYSVYARRYDAATSQWTPSAAMLGSGLAPEMAMDEQGNAIAVWSKSESNGTSSIYANTFSIASQSWNAPERISNPVVFHPSNPKVAAAKGYAIAVWEGGGSVIARHYLFPTETSSGSWYVGPSNLGVGKAPQIAMNANADAIAVFLQADSNSYQRVNFTTFTFGEWGTHYGLFGDVSGNASSPRVVMDSQGNGMVVWFQSKTFGPVGTDIHAARLVGGQAEAPTKVLKSNIGTGSREFDLGGDDAGNAFVLWPQFDGAYNAKRMDSVKYDVGKNEWSAEEWLDVQDGWVDPVIQKGQGCQGARVVMYGGKAIAIWSQYKPVTDGAHYVVMADMYR
jgi:hypothetical protein